jgi:hypothetical protein
MFGLTGNTRTNLAALRLTPDFVCRANERHDEGVSVVSATRRREASLARDPDPKNDENGKLMGWGDNWGESDYVARDYGWSVGRIHKEVHGDPRWCWSINTSPYPAPAPHTSAKPCFASKAVWLWIEASDEAAAMEKAAAEFKVPVKRLMAVRR